MSDHPKIKFAGLLTDPPGPGDCKLRIKSDGTSEGTRVFVVDCDGRELALLGVLAVSWKLEVARGELATCDLHVEAAVETDLDALEIDVRAINAAAAGATP